MGEFRNINFKVFGRKTLKVTPDALYWKKLGVPVFLKATNGSSIFSGSLDRHANIYDTTTFQKVHALDYPNSILSIGISANDETVAVGMVDALVSVSRRETETKASNSRRREKIFKSASDIKFETADVIVKHKKDVYEDSITDCGPQAVTPFLRLTNRLAEEIQLTESLLELEGCINLIISASSAAATQPTPNVSPSLKPSETAREFVVNVS